jgi:hypothetical protein
MDISHSFFIPIKCFSFYRQNYVYKDGRSVNRPPKSSTLILGPASFDRRFRRSALRELALFTDASGGNGQWRSI